MLTTLLEPGLRLTICGLDELDAHGTASVTHVLSILDPGLSRAARLRRLRPAPSADHALPRHHRPLARLGGARARSMSRRWSSSAGSSTTPARISSHLLVHCHAGISRSTAAMATLLARHTPVGRGGGDLRPHPRDPPDRLAELAHDRLRRRDPRRGGPPERRPARALPAAGAAAPRVHGRAASATAAARRSPIRRPIVAPVWRRMGYRPGRRGC